MPALPINSTEPLPALNKPVSVACSDCGMVFTYGGIGRNRFYDDINSNGTVTRYSPKGKGTPCCGKQAHQCGNWASFLSSKP